MIMIYWLPSTSVADVVHATHDVHGRNAFHFYEFRSGGQPARRSRMRSRDLD